MDRYLITQIISILVSFTLLATFYIILTAGLVTELKSFLTPLILIVIAVVLVAIFTTLTKIENALSKPAVKSKLKI